ncbi:MAG: GNAT family N-acetyltransferase [Woeseiaceae bacterium]
MTRTQSRLKSELQVKRFLGKLESSATANCIGQVAARRSVESNADRCTFIDIINYDDAFKALKKKVRGNLNNARNRMEAQGSFEFSTITDSDDMDWAYEHFVELEMSDWKEKKKINDSTGPLLQLSAQKSRSICSTKMSLKGTSKFPSLLKGN